MTELKQWFNSRGMGPWTELPEEIPTVADPMQQLTIDMEAMSQACRKCHRMRVPDEPCPCVYYKRVQQSRRLVGLPC